MASLLECFSLNLTILRIWGLFPPENYKTLNKIHSYLLYAIFILPVPTLGSLYLLVTENSSAQQMSDNAFLIAEMGCFIFKLVPFIRNGKQIRQCVYTLNSPIFNNSHGERQERIVNNTAKICRRNSKLFLTCVFFGVATWAVKPFFLKGYKQAVDVWMPFNTTDRAATYYPVYLFTVIGTFYGAISSGAIDPLIAGLACQATGQLKILKDNLKHLDTYATEQISKTLKQSEKRWEKNEIMNEMVKKCINHHNAVLDFVECYEECFSMAVFSQFVSSVVVICISLLNMGMLNPLTFEFASMLNYLVAMLSQIYLYCYYGTTLYEESNSVTSAIYQGMWYEYDVNIQKDLIILMERTKRPIKVSAGKILELSLETFTTILRRSYSLLAVLKNY